MGKNAEYIFSFIELHMYNYKKKIHSSKMKKEWINTFQSHCVFF